MEDKDGGVLFCRWGFSFFLHTFMGDVEYIFVHIFKSYKYNFYESIVSTKCIINGSHTSQINNYRIMFETQM